MRRSGQILIAIAVVALVTGLGLLFALAPLGGRGKEAPVAAAKETRGPESPEHAAFDRLFHDGVEHLRQGRAHEALVVLDAARRIRPHVPELFVNLGYAHFENGTFLESAEAFRKAVELRPLQDNAYYGLALALERLGDIEGAMGAMRTYVHLAPKDTIHFRRAEAAIREYDIRLGRGDKPLILENEKGTINAPSKSKLGIGHSP